MKMKETLIATVFLLVSFSACSSDEKTEKKEESPAEISGTVFIADHLVAKDEVLRAIPMEYIDKARQNLHIAYQHTSHGTHVSYGVFGLPDFKKGDEVAFAVTKNNSTTNKLDFRDNVLSRYAEEGRNASDLSNDETAFIQATRNYLDDADNAEVNVVMWSWCNIAGHNVAGNYLPGMQTLIDEYGPGGSKIGSGVGQREKAVHFIFMTGHANTNNNVGEGKPANQAKLITDFCKENKYFCLDYYAIDSHSMDDVYWDDAGDNGNSAKYGGNFYQAFQNEGTLGETYYENKVSPAGTVKAGEHNTQHITANRKAFAMWWILARIAGWDGTVEQ